MTLLQLESRSQAAEALAGAVARELAAAVESKGQASFIASGGSSPCETYERLGATALDWRKVRVLPSDERCVPRGSERHNLTMIQTTLGAPAQYIELTPDVTTDSLRPFDVVLLGMGDDGHTASLFPNDACLDDALASQNDVHTAEVPGLPEARISLTPAALLDAKVIFLLIFGEGKRAVYEAACVPGPVSEYPVRVIWKHAGADVRVYWAR